MPGRAVGDRGRGDKRDTEPVTVCLSGSARQGERPGGRGVNPIVDGLFYHSVKHEGRTWAHYGRFLQMERPHLVEHTWVSEATHGVESIVSVTFRPRDGQTEVVLRHSRVPDDKMGRQHEAGWGWVLSMLAERFEANR